MKRILYFAFLSFPLWAGTYKYPYNFNDLISDEGWQGEWYEAPGFPRVPVVNARILLRKGEVLASVRFASAEESDLKNLIFEATPHPIPTCSVRYAPPIPEEFEIGDIYPKRNWGEATLVEKHGYSIVYVPIFPVKYFPATKDGTELSGGELVIETQTNPQRTHALYRGFKSDQAEVKKLIDNPEALKTYPLARIQSSTLEYLVIGPRDYLYSDALQMFLSEKARRGITVGVEELEEIEAKFTGATIQEKIRKAIAAQYKNAGTKYVLLVGNGYSILPTKNVKVSDESIGSDMYYACLDGENNLGDHACELAVGRAPVSTPDEFQVFLTKTLRMELLDDKDPRIWNELNFGERMDSSTLASRLVEQLLTGGKAGDLSTKGYPQNVKANKFYEDFSHTFGAADVVGVINSGDFYTVNHMGHANESYCMRFKSSDIPSLKNSLPFFGITQGCHPGDLHGPNWAAKLVLSPEGGAGGMIANSSFGWYSPGSSDGPSNRHHLMFYNTVFDEGIRNLGRANNRAKERLIAQAKASSTLRKVLVETNLFGDPELVLKFGKR